MGCFWSKAWTVRRRTPFPLPWIILISKIPFSRHAWMYSSTTEAASLGENIWRSKAPSIGIWTASRSSLSKARVFPCEAPSQIDEWRRYQFCNLCKAILDARCWMLVEDPVFRDCVIMSFRGDSREILFCK